MEHASDNDSDKIIKNQNTQPIIKRCRSDSSLSKFDNDILKKAKLEELYEIMGSFQEQISSLVNVVKKQQNSEKTTIKTSKEESVNVEDIIPDINKEALVSHLLSKEYSSSWKRPKLPQYKGNSDPMDHIHKFMTNMEGQTERPYGVECSEKPWKTKL